MCLAVPGRVTEIEGVEALDLTARVDFGGVVRKVSLACLPDTTVGDFVLVHVGFAISKIDPAEAEKIFEAVRELEEKEGFGDETSNTHHA